MEEIETLPAAFWGEVIDFIGYLKTKHLPVMQETVLLSEVSLAKEWNTDEEDDAWADL
jgi:hypothetical protein